MKFEELLGIDGDAVVPPAGWANQWGGTYGGYVAATMLHAFERVIPPEHSISVSQIGFVRLLQPDTEATLSTEVHRSGSTATSLTGRLEQDGETAAVAMAWAAASVEQPSRTDAAPPAVGPPGDYERSRTGDARNSFVDRDFEMRTVPTSEDTTRWVHWIRLTRLEIADDETWPAAAVALVADVVGAGPHRAASLTLGAAHATLALDLTIHITVPPVGPWLLAVMHNVALARGRAVGRGELYDERGTFAASITQQALVRAVR